MSPRGKVQNEEMRNKTLEKITHGALITFADYGYYGATMKKIAAATDLSYGLVYHYFPSKEKVFRHMIKIALERTSVTFDKAMSAEGTAWEKLTRLSEIMVQDSFTEESVLFFHVVLQALTQGKDLEGLHDEIMDASKILYDYMIPLIIEAQEAGIAAEGNPFTLVMSYLSLIQGLALFAYQGGEISSMITPDILLNILKK